MIEELFELFEKKDDLEDELDLINTKIEVMVTKLKFKEPSFKECKKYNLNWLHDF